jgi:hypothetical protein
MSATTKRLTPKVILLASLGLMIPVLLVAVAFLAIKSDAKNQQEYQKQQQEILERIAAREAAEKATSEASLKP